MPPLRLRYCSPSSRVAGAMLMAGVKAKTIAVVLVGAAVVAGGYLAGTLLGEDAGGTRHTGLQLPSPTSTDRSSAAIPVLGQVKRLPTLHPTSSIEATAAVEGSTYESAPSYEPYEQEYVPTPEPTPSHAPEITVAPSG